MNGDALSEAAVFPRAGVAARRWGRFERDYRAWLHSAEGRFSVWEAARTVGQQAVTLNQPAPSTGS